MSPKWGNSSGSWGKYAKRNGAWEWAEDDWSTAKQPQARQGSQKNWRCPHCQYTGNCYWWTTCGRYECGKAWEPPAEQGWGYEGGKSENQHELDDTRAHLVSLRLLLPANHPTIGEYTAKVAQLESATVAEIPMAERLTRLLHDGIQLTKQKEAADTAVTTAIATVQSATKALEEKMKMRVLATNAHNANLLEVAELTRPSREAPEEADASPVQLLRGEIEALDPAKLLEHGITDGKLNEFFTVFMSLAAAIEAAKNSTSAAPAAHTAPAPAPVLLAPAPVDPAPVVVVTSAPARVTSASPPPDSTRRRSRSPIPRGTVDATQESDDIEDDDLPDLQSGIAAAEALAKANLVVTAADPSCTAMDTSSGEASSAVATPKGKGGKKGKDKGKPAAPEVKPAVEAGGSSG